MSQIALLIGLFILMMIAFKIIAGIASFIFRIVVFLVLAIAGYLWWLRFYN